MVPSFSAVDAALKLACPVTGSAHPPTAGTAIPNGTFPPSPCNWRITLPHVHLVPNYTRQIPFCQTPAHLAHPYLCPFISLFLRKQSFGLVFTEFHHSFSAQIFNSLRSFKIQIPPEMCLQHSHLGVICKFNKLSLLYENVE